MTLGSCPLSIFCSRGTPLIEVPRVCGPSTRELRQPTLSLSPPPKQVAAYTILLSTPAEVEMDSFGQFYVQVPPLHKPLQVLVRALENLCASLSGVYVLVRVSKTLTFRKSLQGLVRFFNVQAPPPHLGQVT